jgi:hypothetical protein
MAEQKKHGNPFDEANFITGGGLWDGKIVTITAAKTMVDYLKYGDGSAVINDRTGEPAFNNCLEIRGIADEEEAERRETYSAGNLVPTQDGEGFLTADGQPGEFREKSEMAHLAKLLRAGGFDISLLWDAGTERVHVSKLIGARFEMKGEAKLDKDGKPKINKKGYENQKFYPVRFLGYKNGGPPASTGQGGTNPALKDKAIEVVLAILGEAGGKVTRAELVRKISAKMAGDTDANKILALVTKDDFHKDVPWTRDGTSFTL